MLRTEKVKVVEHLIDSLKQVRAVFLTDFRGLNVEEMAEIRRRLQEMEAEYRVVKNRLVKLALKEIKSENLDDLLVGPTAIAMTYQDPVPAAKVLFNFASETEKLKLKGGLLEGKRIDVETIKQLALLRPRDELLAQLVGSLCLPLTKLIYALKAPLNNLCFVLRALSDEKGQV